MNENTIPDEIRENIAKATAMIAAGCNPNRVAFGIGVKRADVKLYRTEYAELWRKSLKEAKDRLKGKAADSPKVRPSITAKVRTRIIEATRQLASGLSMCQAAENLGIPLRTLTDYQFTHRTLWNAAKAEAEAFLVEVVRSQAGTDAMMDDPDRYLVMAGNAESWCKKHGQELFDRKDGMTLTRFYSEWFVPECMAPDASKTYRDAFEVALRRWRFVTGDPPLEEIDNQLLRRYRDFCTQCRGKEPGSRASAMTVRNHLIYVCRLLRKAGPPGLGNHDAAALISQIPFVKLPRRNMRAPTIVPVEHINAVYQQADAMMVPRLPGIDPPAWWRALLVFVWNTGLRRRSIFALRWEWLDESASRFVVPPEAMKAGRGQIVHLPDVVLDHLAAIRPAESRGPVFPWPYDLSHFGTMFHRLQYEAGIPRAAHFGLHAIRRTLATRLWEVNPGAAQLALGHTNDAVTREHYVAGPAIIAKALDGLPQPDAFHTRKKRPA